MSGHGSPIPATPNFYLLLDRRVKAGEVRIDPRGIFTNPPKKGRTEDSYIDKNIRVDDDQYNEPYLDPSQIRDFGVKKPSKQKGEDKKASFFPAVAKWAKYDIQTDTGAVRQNFGSPYEYVEEKAKVKKERERDPHSSKPPF